jgi:uncharacterized protein with NRDE domain
MCTVTFVPTGDRLYITSNRDEKNWRPSAAAPAITEFPSGHILFPKDPHAGGTWNAAHENGNALVFLNGGFVAHSPQPPYRKSRGLILLDLLDSSSPINSFMAINLNNIEPFTAVLWEDKLLFECRWDGKRKHQRDLNGEKPYIWSSVTLYDETVINKRRSWFDEWLNRNAHPDGEAIMHFHQFTGDGDQQNDLLMNRNGKVGTVSVTQLQLSSSDTLMQYLDLQRSETVSVSLSLEKIMAGR